MTQNILNICSGGPKSAFVGNVLHQLFVSGAPGPTSDSHRNQSHSQQNARLGFFECHICLLPRKPIRSPNVAQTRKSGEGSYLTSNNFTEPYRLCSSSGPPCLKGSILRKEFSNEANPTFLVLQPPSSAAIDNASSCTSEVGQRFWRVTSIIDPFGNLSSKHMRTPQFYQVEGRDKREPWDDVVNRVAHWLVVHKLSATILLLGGNRLSKKSLAKHELDSTINCKQESEYRWRPCVAQRVCVQAFALGRLPNNPCKRQ